MTLRRATEADAAWWRGVRNDPTSVAMSRTGRPVSEAAHAAWYAWALHDVGTRLYVAEADGLAIGTGRLSLGLDGTEVAIAVAREHRGCGYGTALVAALVREAEQSGLRRLWAEIKPVNVPSLNAFHRAGFRATGLVRLERAAR